MSEREAQALEVLAAPTVGAERVIALRDVWGAFWSSRALIWIVGIAAVFAFGWGSGDARRLDPLFLTLPFEHLGNLLAAPTARFDSAWYLAIAEHGYEVPGREAFFPLYPALVGVAGEVTGSALLAGAMISSALAFAALYLVHRLVALDFDLIDARNTVWLMAWFPAAFVLSAVYAESLFLALSVGAIYAARLGRWPMAGLLAGLAAGSRSAGVLLLVPLLVIYLYGPRADAPGRGLGEGLRPHHRVRGDLLWLGLVPLGVLAYVGYLELSTGHAMAAFHAQSDWHRIFAPFGGVALGAWSALRGAFQLMPGEMPLGIQGVGAQHATLIAVREIMLFAFLVLAAWLSIEAWRRLPAAYSLYSLSALMLPLSFPATDQPLESLPRFMLVLFPLWIALALWARERGRMRAVLAAMVPLLVLSTALFTTWTMAP